MRLFSSLLAGCAILAALALSAPVSATTVIPAVTAKYTYDFTNSNTTIVTSGPSSLAAQGATKARVVDSNGVEQGNGSGLAAITVTASAWNITKHTGNSNFTLAQSVIGQYAGGLGVTAPTPYDDSSILGCGNGQCGTHQIDNQGQTAGTVSTDLIQLVFSQAVTLGSVTRNAYGLVTGISGGQYVYAYDDDMSWGQSSSSTALTATSAMTQTAYNAMWNGTGSGYDNGACSVGSGRAAGGYYGCADTDTTNTQANAASSAYASKVWYISAGAALSSITPADSIADAFKLTGVTVYAYQPSYTYAPEPATWALMVLGFGAVGTAIRRRKAAERAVAALG